MDTEKTKSAKTKQELTDKNAKLEEELSNAKAERENMKKLVEEHNAVTDTGGTKSTNRMARLTANGENLKDTTRCIQKTIEEEYGIQSWEYTILHLSTKGGSGRRRLIDTFVFDIIFFSVKPSVLTKIEKSFGPKGSFKKLLADKSDGKIEVLKTTSPVEVCPEKTWHRWEASPVVYICIGIPVLFLLGCLCCERERLTGRMRSPETLTTMRKIPRSDWPIRSNVFSNGTECYGSET